jgi:hypothetical protein
LWSRARPGSGKTHMLGWARAHIQRRGGYFFVIDLTSAHDFWYSVTLSIIHGFFRPGPGSEPQIRTMLRRLSSRVALPAPTRSALVGDTPVTRATVDQLISAVRDYAPRLSTECYETARALVLLASADFDMQDLAYAYLLSQTESEAGEFAAWGLRPVERSAESISRDILQLLAISGPTLIGVDSVHLALTTDQSDRAAQQPADTAAQIASELGALLDQIPRGLLVCAAYPTTWQLLRDQSANRLTDTFGEPVTLKGIASETAGLQLVAKQLGPPFQQVGFLPPYPTWPIRPTAFSTSIGVTPRALLVAVERHIQRCLQQGEVAELEQFDFGASQPAAPRTEAAPPDHPGLIRTSRRFNTLRRDADTFAPMSPSTEDVTMPQLLAAGLRAWVIEQGETAADYVLDPPPSGKPALHARLRRVLDVDREAHWSFRAIATPHSAAALQRIRAAATLSGLFDPSGTRWLFLLRNVGWGTGPIMQETLRAFADAGGLTLEVDDEDLRILAALDSMFNEGDPDLPTWILTRKPTQDVSFLQHALAHERPMA